MINDFFERKMNNLHNINERVISSKNRAILKKSVFENSIEDRSKARDLSFIQTPIIRKDEYKTPLIKKNDRTFDDVEMRKTKKSKPPLMSSKLPPAFGIQKKSFMYHIY